MSHSLARCANALPLRVGTLQYTAARAASVVAWCVCTRVSIQLYDLVHVYPNLFPLNVLRTV